MNGNSHEVRRKMKRSACSWHSFNLSAGAMLFAMRCYNSMGHGRHADMGFMGWLQKRQRIYR